MTIDDILNSNLSDTHKIEIITVLQKGGLTPDQRMGREPIEENGKKYYMTGDGEKIPAERLEKNPELRGQQEGKTITPSETIIIGEQEYDVAVADTPELRKKGLKPYSYLRPDEGMLFIFDEDSTSAFTMVGCYIDLDIIFIDDEGDVLEVKHAKADDPKPIRCSEPYRFVLEVNINSGIEPGDELSQDTDDFSEDDKQQLVQKNKMLVLDSNGDVQMRLYGGERIFSRIFTRKMLKAALKAYHTDEDKDYRRVGKLVLTELDAQDSRTPEYTTLDD